MSLKPALTVLQKRLALLLLTLLMASFITGLLRGLLHSEPLATRNITTEGRYSAPKPMLTNKAMTVMDQHLHWGQAPETLVTQAESATINKSLTLVGTEMENTIYRALFITDSKDEKQLAKINEQGLLVVLKGEEVAPSCFISTILATSVLASCNGREYAWKLFE